MNRILVLGSINNDIVVSAERHPNVGETLKGSDLQYFPGGKGANQAVAAARADARTTIGGLVGLDAAGSELVVFLKDAGVDTSLVSTTMEAPTGTALITVAAGDNTILVVAGANKLVPEGAHKRFDLHGGDAIIAQFETPLEATLCAFIDAREAGATTILNPAPAARVPVELLDVTDVLVVNEHEFEIVFGSVFRLDRLTDLVETSSYAGVVIVTLGSEGVVAYIGGNVIQVPGHSVQAVDSTGAGDCFVGYLGAGLVQGCDFQQAMTRANKAAALSVTRAGAASSIPDLKQVEAWR